MYPLNKTLPPIQDRTYHLYTPEGNTAVADAVHNYLLSRDRPAFRTALQDVLRDHPEITDTAVCEAIYDRTEEAMGAERAEDVMAAFTEALWG